MFKKIFTLLAVVCILGQSGFAASWLEVPINTGLNHNLPVSTPYTPLPNNDNFWTVGWHNDTSGIPSAPFAAKVIAKYPTWATPQTVSANTMTYGSQWISAYPTWENHRPFLYAFKTCFCLQEGFQKPQIKMNLKHEDSIGLIVLEQNNFGSYTILPASTFAATNAVPGNPSVITFNDPTKFKVGKNCIWVLLANDSNDKEMGLNIAGTVSAYGILPKPGSGINNGNFQPCNCSGTPQSIMARPDSEIEEDRVARPKIEEAMRRIVPRPTPPPRN